MEQDEARRLGGLGYWTVSNGARALELYASSGLSAREFALRTGISRSRLQYWRSQLAGAGDNPAPAAAARFREVTVGAAPGVQAPASVAELRGVGPWRVRLRADFDAAALGRLLDVLESRC